MEEVYLQYWEESGRYWGVRPDGCSLHLTEQFHKNYVDQIYALRDRNNIPDEYDKIVGELLSVRVKKDLYDLVSICDSQNQLANLIKLGDLIL